MTLQSPKSIGSEAVPIHDYSLADQIAQTPANGVVKLPNGSFPMRADGTIPIAKGVTIEGNSDTGTIITRDPHFPENNQPVLLGRGDYIKIRNLTIDCGAPDKGLCEYAYAGLHIFGTNARVENVRFIRPTGNYARAVECWTCWIVSGEVLPTGIVSDCTVSDVRGDYVEGFSASGACTFRNCRVDFPALPTSDQPPFFNGYQGAGRSQFINCIQNGGTGFFYTDTESVAPRFQGCLGTNLVRGVWVVVPAGQTSDGLTIDGCEFQLIPDLAGNRYGVAISGDGAIRNVRVVNSVFKWSSTPDAIPGPATVKYAAAVTGGIGTVFTNNLKDQDFGWSHEPTATINGNTTIARAPQAPLP